MRTYLWRIMLARLDDAGFHGVSHMPEMQSENWRVGGLNKLNTSSRIITKGFWKSAALSFVDVSEAGLGINCIKHSRVSDE